MDRYRISVFYKQLPERATITQLLNPATLQSGDRYTRVFKGEMEFSNCSENNVLDQLFATFNGQGKPLPPNTRIPRSICVGDIVVTEEETRAFLVTASGFDKLPFAPRDENFEISQTLSRQLADNDIGKTFTPSKLDLNTVWGAPEIPPHVPTGKSALPPALAQDVITLSGFHTENVPQQPTTNQRVKSPRYPCSLRPDNKLHRNHHCISSPGQHSRMHWP